MDSRLFDEIIMWWPLSVISAAVTRNICLCANFTDSALSHQSQFRELVELSLQKMGGGGGGGGVTCMYYIFAQCLLVKPF